MHRRSIYFWGNVATTLHFRKRLKEIIVYVQGQHVTTCYQRLQAYRPNYERRSIRNRKAATLHQRGPASTCTYTCFRTGPPFPIVQHVVPVAHPLTLRQEDARCIVRHPADDRVLSSKLTGERILIRRVERPAADLLIIFHDRDNDRAYLPRTRVMKACASLS